MVIMIMDKCELLLSFFLSFFLGPSCNYMRAHLALVFPLGSLALWMKRFDFFFCSCKVEQSSLSRFLIEELLTSSKSSVLIYVIPGPSLSSKLCVPIDSETIPCFYSTSPTSISTSTSSSLSLATTSHRVISDFLGSTTGRVLFWAFQVWITLSLDDSS